jgi:hypothetical protein
MKMAAHEQKLCASAIIAVWSQNPSSVMLIAAISFLIRIYLIQLSVSISGGGSLQGHPKPKLAQKKISFPGS